MKYVHNYLKLPVLSHVYEIICNMYIFPKSILKKSSNLAINLIRYSS